MDEHKSIEELVVRQEEKLAEGDRGRNAARRESLKLPVILLGAAVYSFGMNYFLRPLNLFSGGLLGFAQLFRELLSRAGLSFGGFDVSGVLYYVMNIPALVIALRNMRRRFIVKTIFAVTAVTVLLSLIPVPVLPVLDDVLANTIIAGLISGVGVGMILWSGACDGGVNLIGMLYVSLRGKGSVGQLSIIANVVLYGFMLFLFDIPTVIYSLIYSVFTSIAADRIHTQNISTQVMVITKLEDTVDMEVEVMGQLYRGMTQVDASGTFTGDPVKIFIIFISKFESNRLRSIVRSYDPQAFIIETEGVRIEGNFLRKLT